MILFRINVLAVVLGTTAACAPWHQREMDYPGEGVGIIQVRADPAGGAPIRNVMFIPIGKIVVPLPAVEVATPTPGKFDYQILAKDGTLHLVANDAAFDIGTCVAFSGYADGPSRTHWSFGRTILVKSENCGK